MKPAFSFSTIPAFALGIVLCMGTSPLWAVVYVEDLFELEGNAIDESDIEDLE